MRIMLRVAAFAHSGELADRDVRRRMAGASLQRAFVPAKRPRVRISAGEMQRGATSRAAGARRNVGHEQHPRVSVGNDRPAFCGSRRGAPPVDALPVDALPAASEAPR